MTATNETGIVDYSGVLDNVWEAVNAGALGTMSTLHTNVEGYLASLTEELRVLRYDSITHPDNDAREAALVGYQQKMDVWASATVARLALETTYGRTTGQRLGGCVMGATSAYRETVLTY